MKKLKRLKIKKFNQVQKIDKQNFGFIEKVGFSKGYWF